MIKYFLYDGRYLNDEDSAICYEVYDSLEEAKQTAPEYGDDTVIVKTTVKVAISKMIKKMI